MNRTFFAIFLSLIIVSVVFILKSSLNDIKSHDQPVTTIQENILSAKTKPKNGQNIFFVDSIRMKNHKKDRPFSPRQVKVF